MLFNIPLLLLVLTVTFLVFLVPHISLYTIVQDALDVIKISKEDQENTFAMLAAVLWLGNIGFSVIDNESHVEVDLGEGT